MEQPLKIDWLHVVLSYKQLLLDNIDMLLLVREAALIDLSIPQSNQVNICLYTGQTLAIIGSPTLFSCTYIIMVKVRGTKKI